MKFRNRVQRGVPTGGQFAEATHDEAPISLSHMSATPSDPWAGGPNPKMMMVPALREEAAASIDEVLSDMEDNSFINQHRTADSFFPAADYDEALFRLRSLQARLEGRTTPPPPDKVANAVSTFKQRLAARKNAPPTQDVSRPPTTDLRDATRTYASQAYGVLAQNPYMVELVSADDEFPLDDYRSAIHALRAVQERVNTAPPPVEMTPKALSTWQTPKVANASFASFQSYNPMTATGW